LFSKDEIETRFCLIPGTNNTSLKWSGVPESNCKEVYPTPFIVYIASSPSTTCKQDSFSTRSVRCSFYPVICLEAPLSINQTSLLVGTILERDEMKKNSSSLMLAFLDFL
jgi:hypothetical protein